MSYTIKKENYPPFGEVNVGYISVNGRNACIVYDPNSNPMRPFETSHDLEACLIAVHDELAAMEPAEEIIEPAQEETTVKKWRPDLFWREFTPGERKDFLELCRTDAVLEDFKTQLILSPVILSNDEQFLSGMLYATSVGVITEERRKIIVDGGA